MKKKKKWIYLERYTFHRQNEVHLKGKNDLGRNTPQTICGPSQKVRGPKYGVVSLYGLVNFIG